MNSLASFIISVFEEELVVEVEFGVEVEFVVFVEVVVVVAGILFVSATERNVVCKPSGG